MRNLKLSADLREVIAEAPPKTKWGVAVLDARTFDVVAGVNRNMRAEALSLSKFGVVTLMNRMIDNGGLALDMPITIEASDVRPGGFLGRLVGQELPMLQVMQAMLHVSDTTGQRALMRFMGGPGACNRALLSQPLTSPSKGQLPLSVTGFQPLAGETGANALFYTGDTTPIEAAGLLGTALRSSIVHRALSSNIFGFGLTRDLPGNALPDAAYSRMLARAQRAQQLSEATVTRLQSPSWHSVFPNMMGIDEGQRHSVALIGGFFLVAALSKGFDPGLPEMPSHPAHDVQSQIGQVVFAHA